MFNDQTEDGPTNMTETCRWNYNLIKYKVVSDYIIYILYYILAYIQQNGDVSLEKKMRAVKILHRSNFLSWYY